MKKWMQAHLYHVDKHSNLAPGFQDVSDVIIGKGKIRFLRSNIDEVSTFKQDARGNWLLTFFRGLPFEQSIAVYFAEADSADEFQNVPKQPMDNYLTKLVFCGSGYSSGSTLGQDCSSASMLLKDSMAVGFTDLHESAYHYGYVDGSGEIFLSKTSDDNFLRHVVLHALAYAYIYAINDVENQLRPEVLKHEDTQLLRSIYQNFINFNAFYFFKQPVVFNRPAMCKAWERIDTAYSVTHHSQELLDKINAIHFILDLKEKEQAEKHRLAEENFRNKAQKSRALSSIAIAFLVW